VNKIIYKTLNVIIITLLSCGVITGGTFFGVCLLFSSVSLYKGNMGKVYEFLPAVLITPIALFLFFKIGNIWRTKTIKYRDEGDKTWMD
jgi:hypothetical protein